MELKELGVWGRNPPADWIQEAAQRWAVLAKRAALAYMDLFRASPLPRVETEVLALVWENPDSAEPALLAGALRVSRQSMTGLLDKLERGGYLERTPHAADRRRKTIRLRKKGLAVVRGFAGGVVRREAALFGTRSEREVSGALDTLDRLLSLVEQWHAEHPFGKANSEQLTTNN